MLFASTTISNGSCVAVVTSTGMATEIGAIQEPGWVRCPGGMAVPSYFCWAFMCCHSSKKRKGFN